MGKKKVGSLTKTRGIKAVSVDLDAFPVVFTSIPSERYPCIQIEDSFSRANFLFLFFANVIYKPTTKEMDLKTDEGALEIAELTLNILAQDKEILQLMEAHGYKIEQTKKGKSLLDKAINSRRQKDACYDAQWELGQQVNAQQTAVRAQFREHAKVARTAYRSEPNIVHLLRIELLQKNGWDSVRQAAYFYHKLQERKLSLQSFGVSDKDIQQATTDITNLMVLRQSRLRQKGKSEDCTQAKNVAFRELRSWIREVRSTARFAFKKNPQMLEAFGVTVRAAV